MSKAPWQDPIVEDVGSISKLVQVGAAKTVIEDGDSGEPLKNPQQDAG